MENFVTANKVVVPEETLCSWRETKKIERTTFVAVPSKPMYGGKKKVVRFKSEEDVINNEGECSGFVTFRIAVSRDELNQILNHKKGCRYSSLKQLLDEMKVSSRKITHVRSDGGEITQKLALETINAQDH